MQTKILKVVRQGEAFSVQSTKSESGQVQKCNIVLRELGGSKYENEYVCAMLGTLQDNASTRAMWYWPPSDSPRTSIRDKRTRKCWQRKLSN